MFNSTNILTTRQTSSSNNLRIRIIYNMGAFTILAYQAARTLRNDACGGADRNMQRKRTHPTHCTL